MTLFYSIVLVGVVVLTLQRRQDILAPIPLYMSIYALFLAINSLALSPFQDKWSPITSLFFWGGSVMFLGGALLASLIHQIRNPKWELDFGTVRSGLAEDAKQLDWGWFRRVYWGTATIYLLSYAGAAAKTGGIPIFMPDPDQARLHFFGATFVTNIGMFFGPLSLILGLEYLLFAPHRFRDKIPVTFVVSLIMLLYGSLAMRLDLFRFLFSAMILYHYGKRNLDLKRVIILGGSAIALFVAFFLIRIDSAALETFNTTLKARIPAKWLWASQIYSYVACNFWNLDYGVERYIEGVNYVAPTLGFDFFRPIFFFLRIEGIVQDTYGFDSIFNDSVNKVPGLNSVNYIWHFYKDFGAVGVFFLPFLFGLLLSFFYRNTMAKPRLVRVCLWAVFAGFVLFSHTAELWAFWFSYMNIGVILLAHNRPRLA